MKSWALLYKSHGETRTDSEGALAHDIRARFRALAEQGHCSKELQYKFTRRQSGRLQEWYVQAHDGLPEGQASLMELPELCNAKLTILALCDSRTHWIHQFSAHLQGTTPKGASWLVAAHLENDRPDDRKGEGACSHAAFHCHVGPGFEDAPCVRVPLPSVPPVALLDWILSLVVRKWEPAPWPAVTEFLADSG